MIHCYKLGGINIVLDIYSGSVHAVDDVAFDMIREFEATSKEDLINSTFVQYHEKESITKEELYECYDQIQALKDAKRLNRSLGTLGGGNHFIEVDRDEEGYLYLVIHSGSRSRRPLHLFFIIHS